MCHLRHICTNNFYDLYVFRVPCIPSVLYVRFCTIQYVLYLKIIVRNPQPNRLVQRPGNFHSVISNWNVNHMSTAADKSQCISPWIFQDTRTITLTAVNHIKCVLLTLHKFIIKKVFSKLRNVIHVKKW